MLSRARSDPFLLQALGELDDGLKPGAYPGDARFRNGVERQGTGVL